MKKAREIRAGDWVRFTGKDGGERLRQWYPAIGTVGQVVKMSDGQARVQWPAGSTSGDDLYYAELDALELAPAPRDVQKLQLLAAICCVAALVLGVHAMQLVFYKQWVEIVCCCVGAATAMRKAMELDRKVQAAQSLTVEPETGADDGTGV